MSKIDKMAAKDARRWAYAEMFYGEGAGTMRKLLNAEITDKVIRIPGYNEKFNEAYQRVNFGDIALKAAKDRKRMDRSGLISKNLGALARGDRRGMSNGFAALVIVGAVAHTTGYDKVAYSKAMAFKEKVQHDWKNRKRDLNIVDGKVVD